MSSLFPATVNLSLQELARHGGDTGPHRDGWGIAYYEGRAARLVKEPEPAAGSACVAFIESLDLRSTTVVSHIRKATHGGICLANTQPFARELGGRAHTFAHNGELHDHRAAPQLALGRFKPVGESDSEHAFCALLGRLEELWDNGGEVPSLDSRIATVAAFAAEVRPLGPFNFIYTDSDALFVHGHKRRPAAGLPLQPPGLHHLCRTCDASIDQPATMHAAGVQIRPGEEQQQQVVLVASVPLTDEAWQPFGEGELMVFRDGRRVGGVAATAG